MAWSGTPIAASGTVPIMAADGTTAINSAANYRQGFIGAFIQNTNVGPMTWRSGVLGSSQPTGAGVPVNLLPVPAATPDSTVQVWPGSAVIWRNLAAGGPYLVTFNGTTNVTLDPADASNPRIDTIVVMMVDQAIDGAGSYQGGYIKVVNGTPGASPLAPTVPSNCLALANVLRPANDSVIDNNVHGVITGVRKSSGIQGGVRGLMEGDSLTDPGGVSNEMTVTTDGILRRWDAVSGVWRGMLPIVINGTKFSNSDFTLSSGVVKNVFSVTVPDPGYPYRVQVNGAMGIEGPGVSLNPSGHVLLNVAKGTWNAAPFYARNLPYPSASFPLATSLTLPGVPYPSTVTGASSFYMNVMTQQWGGKIDGGSTTDFMSVTVLPA